MGVIARSEALRVTKQSPEYLKDCFVAEPPRNDGLFIVCRLPTTQAHTLVPSLQLVQMSISLRLFSIRLRNDLYKSLCHIWLKVLLCRSPSWCWASLSKQQGTTLPSQVITALCHSFQQWLSSSFFIRYLPSLCFL